MNRSPTIRLEIYVVANVPRSRNLQGPQSSTQHFCEYYITGQMLCITFDPNHRLVADGLEADWNAKLRALQDAQERCDREPAADRAPLPAEQPARELALATA